LALTDKELLQHTPEQLLDLLIEECAEVIQAATKAKRFGLLGSWLGYNEGRSNADAVIREALQVKDTLRAFCARMGTNYGYALEKPEHDLCGNQ
jgi:NTP pyrophosphatase (non-canonical NTP hydrolase)